MLPLIHSSCPDRHAASFAVVWIHSLCFRILLSPCPPVDKKYCSKTTYFFISAFILSGGSKQTLNKSRQNLRQTPQNRVNILEKRKKSWDSRKKCLKNKINRTEVGSVAVYRFSLVFNFRLVHVLYHRIVYENLHRLLRPLTFLAFHLKV